jgi:AcrR family transcriptional regulator
LRRGGGYGVLTVPSITRSTREHRARRANTSQRILDATQALLDDGERYTEIPVERILEDAEVSRSTFYAHFPDKAALLARLAERGVSAYVEAADKWAEKDPTAGPEGVEEVLAAMLRVYRRHATVLQALREVAAYDDFMRDVWRERGMREVDAAAAMLRRHQEQGYVSEDVDPQMAAYAVINMIQSAMADHVAYGSPRRDKQLLHALARAGWLVWYGRLPGE